MALSLSNFPGIGPAIINKLQQLHIHTPRDLLFHLPRTYQDRTRICRLNQVRPYESCLIEAHIIKAEIVMRKRRMLLCHIADDHGVMTLRFFHFSQQQYRQMQSAQTIRCFGEVRMGPRSFEMVHPEYQLMSEGVSPPLETRLTPTYTVTDGISQKRLRQWVQHAFTQAGSLTELLPEIILKQMDFPDIMTALQYVHFPPAEANVASLAEGTHPAQQRLAFEELLAHRLSLRSLRQQQHHHNAPCLLAKQSRQQKLLNTLPFPLTKAQQRVITEIEHDLTQPHPMSRLLQGDVGSGKTLVAVIAMLQAIDAGTQAAMMVPTEILATQHVEHCTKLLSPLGIRVAKLVSKQKKSEKTATLTDIASGKINLVVGTHALIQEDVTFQQLGLIVIDEQHRFGVSQRQNLQKKGTPHQLVMTATPIPRTLAMTAYADLDVSVLDELPPGRSPVKTVLVNQGRREEIIRRIREACAQGKQVYWVCTLIAESETLTCQAAEDTYEQVKQALPEHQVGLVHGQMKPNDKQAVMTQFSSGEMAILVATTVIEVGVNVPNASLMIIENPERLGLAQLHQLRGRVGRGSIESYCVLLYQPPLSPIAQERLDIMRQHTDGFLIAEKDLALRGPGEVLGTRQTGEMQFRLANIGRDQSLLPAIQQCADLLLSNHPQQAKAIIQRWVGDRMQYAQV